MGASSVRRRRRRWPWAAGLAVLALAGGYAVADAQDVVPGVLTTAPPWPQADPFPSPTAPPAAGSADPGLDADAPVPGEAAVADLISTLAANPNVGQEPGVLVRDVATGADIAGRASSAPMIPASTTKLLTAVAVIATAGGDHELTTTVLEGAAQDSEAITLRAGGDLTLARDKGDPEAVMGHAGLGDLADQVAGALTRQGRASVPTVVLDESIWTGPTMAPRWDQQDLDEGWAMPMHPIAIEAGTRQDAQARDEDAGMSAAEAFAGHLRDAGIEVGEVVRGEGPASGEPDELGAVTSAPLRQIVEHTLIHSENILAESLGRLVAVTTGHEPSFSGAGEAVAAAIADMGVDVSGLSLADTSGLSSANQVSPATLADVLTLAADGDRPDLLAVIRGLPVAGLEGTLATRLQDGAATGVLSAKTGSLRTVASVAGVVVTEDGRLLAVTVMTNAFAEGGLAAAREAVDDFLTHLAGCGCG